MSDRRREALLEGFVRTHEELDLLQETGFVRGPERRHLERTLDEEEGELLQGMAPLTDEPTVGQEERLAERIGALVAQRRRIEALRRAGAVDAAVTAALLDELDDRVALLGGRLAGKPRGTEEGT